MYKLKNPLYHNDTIIRTEDFTQLADFSLGNLVNILNSFSGNETRKQFEILLGEKFFGRSENEDNSLFDVKGYFPFIIDGFFPVCQESWSNDAIKEFKKILSYKTLTITPGVALVEIKGKPILVALPEETNITREGKYTGDGIVYGKITPIQTEKRNLLVRSSSSGKSYVDNLFTEIEYAVEFFPFFESQIDYNDFETKKNFRKGLFLPDEESFPFMRFDSDRFILDGHFFPSNLYSLQREFWNASSKFNGRISTREIIKSIFKGEEYSRYEGNLARWDERGRLQCDTKDSLGGIKEFEANDLVPKGFVEYLIMKLKSELNPKIAKLEENYENYDMFPDGTILMYNGQNWRNNVTMKGWFMCNGENETPDLRNKFIRCSNGTNTGDTGGKGFLLLEEDNLPPHSHYIPEHSHGAVCVAGGSYKGAFSTNYGGSHPHKIEESGSHYHTFETRYSDGASGEIYVKRAINGAAMTFKIKKSGEHTHTIPDSGAHSHEVYINIPNHQHEIQIRTAPSTVTGSVGKYSALRLNDSIKGYDLIFIMKNSKLVDKK